MDCPYINDQWGNPLIQPLVFYFFGIVLVVFQCKLLILFARLLPIPKLTFFIK